MFIKIVLTLAVVALVLPAAASARPPMSSCGDTSAKGVLVGDVTARRVTCKRARKVARAVPARCGENGTCAVQGFSCITARALEELRFARCTKARNNDELYKTIRFDFGS